MIILLSWKKQDPRISNIRKSQKKNIRLESGNDISYHLGSAPNRTKF